LTESSSLFARLGGDGAVKAVVDRFYQRVIDDPDLAAYFAGVELSVLRRHQVAFISQATGGPADYDGLEMKAAHERLSVTGPAFDRVVEHLVATLQEKGIPPGEIEEVGAVLGPLREQIVTG
jgi:hemoglobin